VSLKPATAQTYKVIIENDVIRKIPTFLKKLKSGQKYAIITDSKVGKLYGFAFVRFLKNNGIDCEMFSFPEGEISKNLKTVETLAAQLLDKKFDRKDAILSLGGGVVGDIAGFLASIYMRGIPYIQIPTTLLAMVDSSIGGKTGVDLSEGKNLIGTFNQPKAVFIDTNYLKTLSKTQVRNGLAEIIKYSVIFDEKLFTFIEKHLQEILSLEPKTLNKIIAQSIAIKSKIVEKDEKENGERMLLNYGHTYGHIIEKLSGYKLLHGYAISIGMVLANRLAVEKKLLDKKSAERIKNILMKAELPIATMKIPSIKDLSSDKKKHGDFINFILPTKIGKAVIHKEKCL
ncbi:MAG: 3-dehydroquinate synthase, partial [Candidatus Gracilibacteria bacterium]